MKHCFCGRGKLIARKEGSMPIPNVFAFVVKKGNISGQAGAVGNVVAQVAQAFDNPYLKADGQKVKIQKVVVLTSGRYTKNFMVEINANLRFQPYSANTYFWSREDLVALIDEHCPNRWPSLYESYQGLSERIQNLMLRLLRSKGWKENFDLQNDGIKLLEQYSYLCDHLKSSGNTHYRSEILKYLEEYNLERATELLLRDLEMLGIEEEKNRVLNASRLFELAKIKSIQGQYEKAEKIYLESLRYDGENTDALSDYGLLLFFQDRFRESVSVLNRAHKLDLKFAEGEVTENSIVRKLNVCHSLFKVGKYHCTTKLVGKCLEDAKNILDPHHSLFGVIYNFMGQIKLRKGAYAEALEWTEKAVEQARVANNNREQYTSLNNLGQVYIELGNREGMKESHYHKALQQFHKAFRIAVELEKEDFGLKDVLLSNIGTANYYLKEFDEAISYLQDALDLQIRMFGADHHKVANRYNNLANCFAAKKDYEKSDELLKKSLAINLKVYGTEDHLEVANNYLNLGTLALHRSQTSAGKDYLFKCWRILMVKKIGKGMLYSRVHQLNEQYGLNLDLD
ncbi:MAG: tetratricopeptide repeat protein [Bacteroidota bacterium]